MIFGMTATLTQKKSPDNFVEAREPKVKIQLFINAITSGDLFLNEIGTFAVETVSSIADFVVDVARVGDGE